MANAVTIPGSILTVLLNRNYKEASVEYGLGLTNGAEDCVRLKCYEAAVMLYDKALQSFYEVLEGADGDSDQLDMVGLKVNELKIRRRAVKRLALCKRFHHEIQEAGAAPLSSEAELSNNKFRMESVSSKYVKDEEGVYLIGAVEFKELAEELRTTIMEIKDTMKLREADNDKVLKPEEELGATEATDDPAPVLHESKNEVSMLACGSCQLV